jgi:DMSO/TMAO reductase YedYZ molybdopterin-dependent catalytic subunit
MSDGVGGIGVGVIRVRNHSLRWLSVLVILLGVALVTSCRPSAVEPGLDPACNETVVPPSESPQADTGGEEKYFDLPREVTSTEDLHLTGQPPELDIESYRLEIEGLVENPLSLTYEDILAYPTVTEVVRLICPGVFQDNAEWTGVPVWVLLEEAGIKPEATEVVFQAMASTTLGSGTSLPYTSRIPLEEIVQNDSIFLAHTVNGEILPLEHGYPIRLVAKDRFGYDWVKWVERLIVE